MKITNLNFILKTPIYAIQSRAKAEQIRRLEDRRSFVIA